MEEKRRKEQEEQEKKMRMEMLLKQIQDEGRKREELKKSEDKKTINDLNDDDDDEDDIGATTSSSLKNFEAAFDKIIEEDKKKKGEAREHKIIKKRKKIDTSIITSYIENNTMYNRFIKDHTKQMSAMDPEIKKELEKSIKKEEKSSDEENVNDYDYDEDRIRKEKEKAEDLSTIGDDEMVHRKKTMEQKKEGVKVYQGHVIEDPEKKKKNEKIIINKFEYAFAAPKRFDIIVFEQKGKEHVFYNVKRVIGLPGERVIIKDGAVYVNDKKINYFDFVAFA